MCKYCNTTFVPNPANEHTSIKKLDNAELYFHKFNNKEMALKYYGEAAELDPGNFRVWWGLSKVKTNNFEDCSISTSAFKDVKGYIEKALLLTSSEVKDRINVVFKDYENRYNERLKHIQDELSDKINSNIHEVSEYNQLLNTTDITIGEKQAVSSKIAKDISGLKNSINTFKNVDPTKNIIFTLLSVAGFFFILSWFNNWISGVTLSSGRNVLSTVRNILLVADGIFFFGNLIISITDISKLSKKKRVEKKIAEKEQERKEIEKDLSVLNGAKSNIKSEIHKMEEKKTLLKKELNAL